MVTKRLADLGNIALLVIDIQNDFCHSDGAFAKLGLNVQSAQAIVPKLQKFINEVRKCRVPIIYSKQVESLQVSPKNLVRKHAMGKPGSTGVCLPNSWGSELYKLKPRSGEHVLVKHTYDFFSNKQLNTLLRKHNIDTVIVSGLNTDVCVDSTIRSAFTHEYHIVIPQNLVATPNQDGEKYYLQIFDRFFGTVTDSKNILSYLKAHNKRSNITS